MKRLLTIIIGLFLLVSLNGQILRYSNYTASTGNGLLDSLVFYFSLEETSGTLVDAAGSNDATAYGNPTYAQTGAVGNCLSFDGDGDYLAMTEVADLRIYDQDVSFSFWVYLSSAPAAGTYYGVFGGETNSLGVVLFSTTAALRLWAVAMGGPSGGPNISTGEWVHIVVTFDNSETTNNVNYYVNGDLTTVSIDLNPASDRATLYIGSTTTTTNLFNGLLDETAMWKGRILSSDDVAWLYNSGNGRQFSELD